MNVTICCHKPLQDRPCIRLENQLIFQLKTEIHIGLMKQPHRRSNGRRVNPALAKALTEQTLHDCESSIDRIPASLELLRRHADPTKDQWINQCLALYAVALDPAFQKQTQLSGLICSHSLMEVRHHSHAFQIWKCRKACINGDGVKPPGSCLIDLKPDIMHGLKSSVRGLEPTDLKVLVTLRVDHI